MVGMTIYHPTQGEKKIATIDFTDAWRKQGWTNTPSSDTPVKLKDEPILVPPPVDGPKLVDPVGDRIDELKKIYEDQGFSAIQEIAQKLKIEKPPGGWDDAIPLIAKAEAASS